MLNWDAFASLPGSADRNFELLCRGIVRHNFGSYGILRSLANQPGVEFHLKLDRRCDALGEPGRWWGWQCKWYDLPASGALGTMRRSKIKDGVRKTERHVPGLTDWVLWTRRPLTRADQEWFKAISSTMTLHLMTGDDVDTLLVGQAAALRGTYFGELVLTPEMLKERHDQAVAPIRARWQPEVHHVLDAERELRRMLGDEGSWDALSALARNLRAVAQLAQEAPAVPEPLESLVTATVDASKQSADALDRVVGGIRDGDLDRLRDDLASRARVVAPNVSTAPRQLRSGNHRAGLYVTNAAAGCRETLGLLTDVEAAFSSRVVAVLAPAGCGKTQLAAQLTAGTDARPCGVLLHGRDLHASHTIDELAQRVSIAGQPVPGMDALLAALDAAGQRAHHRLPMVIDGLNEAEDPRLWKSFLAALDRTLAKYPYVLVVCTLRPEFVDDALPDGTRTVEIQGYGTETLEAIREHFRFWKIDATDASVPAFLGHPLTLRLFCEVTNPTRQRVVGIDAMPGSLTALFDRYLDQVGDRIAALASRTHRYFAQDVRAALTIIANKLWDSRTRSLDIDELRQALGDAQRPWDQSLVRALEHEGVLLRMPSMGRGAYVPVYDRLGGHLIANALLAKFGEAGFVTWIREPSTTTLIASNHNDQHPLADDVVYSLVGQVPRRFHSKQLWQFVDDPLRASALRYAARLEAAYLDTATVDALLDLAHLGDAELLEHLREVRGTRNHPLNAEALDRALRPMNVADRDSSWTEWVRSKHAAVLKDLEHLEQRWRKGSTRPGDRLRARWVMWTLTSTIRHLRDQATRSLYWFGRADPEGMFDLSIESLAVNDAYVAERMLAACYGVAMSHPRAESGFEVHMTKLLQMLADALVGASASTPTNHYLTRLYVRGIVAFAEKFYPSSLPDSLRNSAWSFATAGRALPIPDGDPRAEEVGRTLQMDFENYTLGRLFEDRSNYDMNHQGHQEAVAYVCGTTWALGWRAEKFEATDAEIAEDAFRSAGRGLRPQAERYGKKYGWIGFFTYAGLLQAEGRLPDNEGRLADVDIDPSFPQKPPADGDGSIPQIWLSPSVTSHERWICDCTTRLPRTTFVRDKIGDHVGPWVAVHAFVRAEDRVLGRQAWAFISALVMAKQSAPRLVAALNAGQRPWATREVPSDYYTFAGEIPWHPTFAAALGSESGRDAYREQVRIDTENIEVEVLAHHYAWESYHSETNQAGNVLVPSKALSAQLDLHGAAQSFDQFGADGRRATITLSGVDGLNGSVLYVRKDLLRRYVGERTVVWFEFGERQLRPYPPTPPQWLKDAHSQRADAWHLAIEADLREPSKPARKANEDKRPARSRSATKKRPAKRTSKYTTPKTSKRRRRRS